MRIQHATDNVLGPHRSGAEPLFVASKFAEIDNVKISLVHSFAYHAL